MRAQTQPLDQFRGLGSQPEFLLTPASAPEHRAERALTFLIARCDHYVLYDRKSREQPSVLESAHDTSRCHSDRAGARDVFALVEDRTLCGPLKAAQYLHERRFAGTVRAYQ